MFPLDVWYIVLYRYHLGVVFIDVAAAAARTDSEDAGGEVGRRRHRNQCLCGSEKKVHDVLSTAI